MTNIARRKALAWGFGATSALLFGPSLPKALAAQPAAAIPDAPPGLPNAGIMDARGRFADLSAQTPIDPERHASFIKSKIRDANSHPGLDASARNKAVQEIIDRIGPSAEGLADQPIPGGVGYGVFYTPEFKVGWGLGTALSYDIVCPEPPGGNVDYFLYLTATNRSALGVEAFVGYFGQDIAYFQVFDWAQAATMPWQINIPFDQLSDYLAPNSTSNHPLQKLSVWNSTASIGNGLYRNQALLYNHTRHGWDLVYQYDYPATDDQQKVGWIGSWSPIVETFQPSYNGTRPMGAMQTLIRSADINGNWGRWAHLDPSESYVRTDDVGFQLRSLAPNFAFIVVS